MMENRIKELKDKIETLRGFETVLNLLKYQAEWCGEPMVNEDGDFIKDENGKTIFTPPTENDYGYNDYKAYLKSIEIITAYINKI